jgi:uncharacterized integral membrane protein
MQAGRTVSIVPPDQQSPASDSRRRTETALLRLVGALVACLVVAIFAVENDQAVHLVFLGWHPPAVRLPVLLFGVLLLGGLAAAALGAPELFRLRRQVRDLRRQPPVRTPPAPVAAPDPDAVSAALARMRQEATPAADPGPTEPPGP